jgi:hypothetical protein
MSWYMSRRGVAKTVSVMAAAQPKRVGASFHAATASRTTVSAQRAGEIS